MFVVASGQTANLRIMFEKQIRNDVFPFRPSIAVSTTFRPHPPYARYHILQKFDRVDLVVGFYVLYCLYLSFECYPVLTSFIDEGPG